MKKKVFLVLVLALIVAGGVFAQRSTPNPDEHFEFRNGVITGYVGGDNRVVIPTELPQKDRNGNITGRLPVTEIGSRAFAGNKIIDQVVIPASVHSIGSRAFQGSTLRWVTIQGTLRSIGDRAFEDTVLQSFVSNWPHGLQSIPTGLYQGTHLNGTLVIPEGVTEIGNNAFAGTQITSVTLPRSINRIGSNAFAGCSQLQTVTIPSSVTSIIFGGNNCFSSAPLNDASKQALIARGAPVDRNGNLRY